MTFENVVFVFVTTVVVVVIVSAAAPAPATIIRSTCANFALQPLFV